MSREDVVPQLAANMSAAFKLSSAAWLTAVGD
jgi:hypothetical protein